MRQAQEQHSARTRFSCPVYGFQEMINGKYKLRIIWTLQDGPRRYGEMKKGILRDMDGSQEIAPRVLSRELKTLAAFGLIARTDYQEVPPKVEYTLTPVGQTLLPIIEQMIAFGRQHLLHDRAPSPNEA